MKNDYYHDGIINHSENDLGFQSDVKQELELFTQRVAEKLVRRLDPETKIGVLVKHHLEKNSLLNSGKQPENLGVRLGTVVLASTEPTSNLSLFIHAEVLIGEAGDLLFPIRITMDLEPFNFILGLQLKLVEAKEDFQKRITSLEHKHGKKLTAIWTQIPSKDDFKRLLNYESEEDLLSVMNKIRKKMESVDRAVMELESNNPTSH